MAMDDRPLLQMLLRIEQRLANLEARFNENVQRATTATFQIDTVNIQTLALDQLLYQLDNIDVKEISGMLNIGNTSAMAPARVLVKDDNVDKQPTTTATATGEDASDISIKVGGKPLPYRPMGPEPPAPGGSVHQPAWTPDAPPGFEPPHAAFNYSHPPLHSTFHLRDIHVGTVEDASAINLGNSFPTNFKSVKKHNQGFGNVVGNENDIQDIASMLEEKDVIEAFNETQDPASQEWLTKLAAGLGTQQASDGSSPVDEQADPSAEA